MASTSRKRTRDNSSTDETLHESPKPRKKSRSSCAGRQGQGGKKNLQSSAHPKSTETPPIVASSDAQQGSVNNNTEDPAQQRKKVRLELEDRDVSASDMPESHIFKLPPEIIGEILVLTGSPRHILAFARTCKHFCYTLIGEGTQYIWRRARRGPQCTFLNGPDTISLPDPPKSFFTESACAAFLFDPGPCDNCGKKTSAPYASFALRIRFCNDSPCRRLPDGLSNPEQFQLIVPTNERSDITSSSGVYWPFPKFYSYQLCSRDTDIAKAREEFLNETGGDNEKRLETLRSRNKEWMHFCSALAMWQVSFREKYREVKRVNEQFAHGAADKFGWEYSDMIGYTVFGKFSLHKTKLLEDVVFHDMYLLRDQIESELLALEEKRKRRKGEIALTKNREDVEALYNKLCSTNAYEHLPSLPTFRQLPIIQLLQAGIYDGHRNIANTLQNNALMRQQLDQEVERWIETAKQDLAVVLGFPRHWKSANKNILHPVERCTAWFLCTKCTAGINHQTDGCLDFADACRHVCPGKHGKNDRFRRSKRAAWNPGNFIKDENAINVTKSALSKLKMSDETMASFPLRIRVSPVICTSCEPSVVLVLKNMIGHSHRHKSMEISFVSEKEVTSHLNGFAYPYGLAAKFLRHCGKAVQKEIDKKNFGCRICLKRKQTEEIVNVSKELANSTEGDVNPFLNLLHCTLSERPEEMPPLFSFNGMRSHLKAKHGIESIRDEDFFCSEPPNFSRPICPS